MAFKVGDKVRLKAGQRERAGLRIGVTYTVEALFKFEDGDDGVRLEGIRNNGIDEGGWMAYRFEPVEAAVAAPAFKAGDVVVCVHPLGVLEMNREYLVVAYPSERAALANRPSRIDINAGGGVRTFNINRFKLKEAPIPAPAAPMAVVEEAPLPLVAGCTVEVINAAGIRVIALGERYVVERIDAVGLVRLEGINNFFSPARFKVVAPAAEEKKAEAFNLDAWKPKKGDKVVIVKHELARDALGRQHGVVDRMDNGEEVEIIDTLHYEGRLIFQLGFRERPWVDKHGIRPAFNFDAWEPKVGEMVLVVAEDRYTSHGMRQFINDGVARPIHRIDDDGRKEYYIEYPDLPGRYYFWLKDSIRPANWKPEAKKKEKKEEAPNYELPPIPEGAKKVEPFVPLAAPEAPKSTLREDLYKAQEAIGIGHGLCSYSKEDKKGRQIHQTSDVCHARLNTHEWGTEKMTDVGAVAYGLRHDLKRTESQGESVEAHKRYADYIISRSPFSSAFITRDINEACEKDIFMNVDANRNQVAAGAVALRVAQEYDHRPALFCMLVDAGVSEHSAWVMCCAFQPMKDNYSFYAWGGAHDVIDKNRNLQDLVKFFRVGFHTAKGTDPVPYREDSSRYVIAEAVAGGYGEVTIGTWLDKETIKKVKGEGWNKQVTITKEAVIHVAKKFEQLINWE